MGCKTCGGGASAQASAEPETMYEVTLPDGEKRVLNDHDSRVAMTMAGGGSREKVTK